MPTIHIKNNAQYERAVKVLLAMGGMFWTKPTNGLVIGEGQYQALIQTGVVKPNGKKVSGRGKKKKKV